MFIQFITIASPLLFLSAQAANLDAKSLKACQWIDSVYSQCQTAVKFDGERFQFRDGLSVSCSDGKDLSFYDRMEKMDIRSVLSIPYQYGVIPLPEVRKNWDPGRLRSESLLKAVFGQDESAVRMQLVPVKFLGQKIKFQKNLGAAAALEAVSEDLLRASSADSTLRAFLRPFTAGEVNLKEYGFYWRNVSGTNRLSTHSFGTAIDLLLNNGPQYWLWDEKARNPEKAKRGEIAYKNDHYIPARAPKFHPKVVEIFEKHGFIWGGKWNHYDTMHFEYRPEFMTQLKADCSAPAIMEGFEESFADWELVPMPNTENLHDH